MDRDEDTAPPCGHQFGFTDEPLLSAAVNLLVVPAENGSEDRFDGLDHHGNDQKRQQQEHRNDDHVAGDGLNGHSPACKISILTVNLMLKKRPA